MILHFYLRFLKDQQLFCLKYWLKLENFFSITLIILSILYSIITLAIKHDNLNNTIYNQKMINIKNSNKARINA